MTISSIGSYFSENFPTLEQLVDHPKPILTLTAIALSVLGSMVLTYYAPVKSLLGLATITVFSFYQLPTLVEQGNRAKARLILVASLVAFGSLAFGWSLMCSALVSRNVVSAIRTHNFKEMLTISLFVTGLIGYGVSIGTNFLNRAYLVLHDPVWKDKLDQLTQKLRQATHSQRQSFFYSFQEKIGLVLALCYPEKLQLFLNHLNHRASSRLLIIVNTILSHTAFERFQSSVEIINIMATNHQLTGEISFSHKMALYKQLKASFEILQGEELDRAISTLQDNSNWIVQDIVTISQFLSLFEGKALEALHKKMSAFIEDIHNLEGINEYCQTTISSLKQLEQAIDSNSFSTEELSNQLGKINQSFIQKRRIIEKIYQERQRWLSFFESIRNLEIPEEYSLFLIQIAEAIHDPEINQQIDIAYQKFMRTGSRSHSQDNEQDIMTHIQRLSNKLPDQESRSACEFLGAERCEFKLSDYEELREWLKVDSFADIDEKMKSNEIQLATEEDLYQKGILPRGNELILKEQIKQNLKTYITLQFSRRKGLKTRAYSVLSSFNATQASFSLELLTKKVSQCVYKLVTRGILLVPVIMQPIPSAVGFGVGMASVILKRFGSDIREERAFEFERSFFFLRFERSFFSLGPHTRQNMETFVQGALFEKMRMLNKELLFTTLMAQLHWLQVINGFLQGKSLGREVTNLIIRPLA